MSDRPTELLDILRENGDWMSRKAIAVADGRGHLHAYALQALSEMVEAGIIEVRSTLTKKGDLRYEYRALTPPDANGA